MWGRYPPNFIRLVSPPRKHDRLVHEHHWRGELGGGHRPPDVRLRLLGRLLGHC